MLRAVIFDVDGVLVDSYHAHLRSWQALAAEQGFTLTEDQFAETFGRTSRDIIRHFWRGEEPADDRIRALDERKEALYRSIVAENFPAMDGAVELVRHLDGEGIRLAVGSSGPPENVDLALERLGVRAVVSATVTGFDVTRGKPDPQVFLIAARRLAIQPGDCLVIEDAPDGIRAARAAGMAAVALLSTARTEGEFAGTRPSLVVRSLRDLTPAILKELV